MKYLEQNDYTPRAIVPRCESSFSADVQGLRCDIILEHTTLRFVNASSENQHEPKPYHFPMAKPTTDYRVQVSIKLLSLFNFVSHWPFKKMGMITT